MRSQTNLRLPENLRKAAEKHARLHNCKNLQDLAREAIRDKVLEPPHDESLSQREIALIDRLITASLKTGRLYSEKELMKALE
ncbi:MAG TPA: hypothetical protein VJA40_04845 [archaeon]|nr:hypothetical protein [archaeon]